MLTFSIIYVTLIILGALNSDGHPLSRKIDIWVFQPILYTLSKIQSLVDTPLRKIHANLIGD
jgi:hypothetical protein